MPPTTTGYGVIAHEVLSAMKLAGVPGADPDALPWDDIVQADSLLTDTPKILSSLRRTLALLFGKLNLDQVVRRTGDFELTRAAGLSARPCSRV